MPYISQKRRDAIFSESIEDLNSSADTPGELNYLLTFWINEYMAHKGLSYQTINDIVGALEGAKLEFYRRVAVPYENSKMAQNGDVYSSPKSEDSVMSEISPYPTIGDEIVDLDIDLGGS